MLANGHSSSKLFWEIFSLKRGGISSMDPELKIQIKRLFTFGSLQAARESTFYSRITAVPKNISSFKAFHQSQTLRIYLNTTIYSTHARQTAYEKNISLLPHWEK
jgi:hypothetical protein